MVGNFLKVHPNLSLSLSPHLPKHIGAQIFVNLYQASEKHFSQGQNNFPNLPLGELVFLKPPFFSFHLLVLQPLTWWILQSQVKMEYLRGLHFGQLLINQTDKIWSREELAGPKLV